MIGTYLKKRLNLTKFTLLAILLSLFICNKESTIQEWFFNIGFLICSFLVFRIIDDAGSVYLDRMNHPDRTYLNNENFPKFLTFCGLVLLIYLISLGIYSVKLLFTIGTLIVLSILLYLLIGKNKILVSIVPLLKYPILVWYLHGFSQDPEVVLLSASTFFLLASHDIVEQISEKKGSLALALLFIIILGSIILKPWIAPLNILYLLPPLLVVGFLGKWKYSKYFSLLYFPFLYFLINPIS